MLSSTTLPTPVFNKFSYTLPQIVSCLATVIWCGSIFQPRSGGAGLHSDLLEFMDCLPFSWHISPCPLDGGNQ